MRAILRQPNQPWLTYDGMSYVGGVNLRQNRLDIPDNSATAITNFDITIDGKRKKRKEPKIQATLSASPSGYVNGMAPFVDSGGNQWLVSTLDGHVFKWDGVSGGTQGNGHVEEYTPKLPVSGEYSLNATNRIRFSRVYNNLYGVDGSSYLFRFNGTECRAVVGTSQNLPIIPGTVIMSNGTEADNVTDDGSGNLFQHGNQIGTISYTTGAYHFTSFPWTTGPVTAEYYMPLEHELETFTRAASNGSLQYMALPNAPISLGILILSDEHSHHASANSTPYDSENMPGWYQLVDDGSNVVGAYNPTTGQLFVDQTCFSASDSITAEYYYGTESVNSEDLGTDVASTTSWQDMGVVYSYFSGCTLAHAPVVAGSISITAVDENAETNPFCPFTDSVEGHINELYVGGQSEGTCAINYVNGTIGNGGSDIGQNVHQYGGSLHGSSSANYQYFTQHATEIFVGIADADGKLYRFRTSATTLAEYPVTIYEGSNTVTGTPASGGGELKQGQDTVGTITTSGIVSVTSTGVFTAYSTPQIKYYTPYHITGQSIQMNILDGSIGGLVPFGAQDILWWNNRLWLTGDNSLSFSDAYAPESFSQPPLAVSATGKLKLLGYSYNRLYLFNAEAGALGEIYYVDVTDADPTKWRATSLYAGMNFVSSDCILRAATNDSADIFYRTAEGWRSLKTTLQDHVSGPSLPFDIVIKPWEDELNLNALNKCWAIVWNDELFVWHPKTGSSTPSLVFAYNMKIPRQSAQEGWTRVDMATAGAVQGIEAHCGCKADFGAGEKLYIGSVSGGYIVEMFAQETTNFTATATSKGINFGQRFSDSSPMKLFERFSLNAQGTVTLSLLDDQNTSLALGSITIETSGTKNPVRCLDATRAYGGTFGNEAPRSMDWRVVEQTNDYLELCGFQLVCLPTKQRFIQDEESNPSTISQGTVAFETVTQGAIAS